MNYDFITLLHVKKRCIRRRCTDKHVFSRNARPSKLQTHTEVAASALSQGADLSKTRNMFQISERQSSVTAQSPIHAIFWKHCYLYIKNLMAEHIRVRITRFL